MKKRLLSVVLCGVLAFSALGLTACGSSEADSAPAAQEEADEEEAEEVEDAEEADDADDAVSDETWEQLQDLYVSLTEAYNATVEMYNDDSVAQDDDIEEALKSAEELMSELGDVDRADVKESEAEDYVDAMLAINDIFEAVIGAAAPADGESDDTDYSQAFNECYAGITDDENTYAYLGFGDEMAALMFYNADSNESGSFVGSYETDEDNGAITITDESLGVTMTFTVEEVADGYLLDMGDIGSAIVGEVSTEDFVEAMQAIAEGTEPQF